MNSIIRPFEKHPYSEYDIVSKIGKHDSPAVSAVKRLRRDAFYAHDARNENQSEQNAAAYASLAMTRQSDIVHDVLSRKTMKDSIVEKPSEYVDGFHMNEIREQHRLFKALEKSGYGDSTMVTPSPKVTHAKAMARAYRNDLDPLYSKSLMTNDEKHASDEESKPAFDWVKVVRKECLRRMKSTSVEERSKLIQLTRIITRREPIEQFLELKNIYEDADEMKMEMNDIMETLICFT